nr:MAG TPA: hypothetical protein [Caudoviricetes sp.]
MSKEEIIKILSKIKDTVGENNYKLALAITGHRTGKIKDIIMCSKDGELLLEYIENLEQQCKKQKEVIDKAIQLLEDDNICADIRRLKPKWNENKYVVEYELLDILNEAD